MVSVKEDSINFDKLEEELGAAVDADERYQRENDAKFRAVEQRVGTYEEFRDIVLASHIKPLDKGDKLQDERFKQQWNIQASANLEKASDTASNNIFDKKTFDQVPKNGHEFTKQWRRSCKTNQERYSCLLQLGSTNLGTIFKAEVGFGLLGEFFAALNEQFKESDNEEIIQILDQLSKTNRFKLNLDFLSSAEKNTCIELLNKLEHSLRENSVESMRGQLQAVKQAYGIKAHDS